ncbi:serine hydrolase [Rhodohalobacter barkolensis]|uniref:Beta-lactamase class A catalytic domain-containing protein n=1 Tax=Rhodohalobacter barkolensis TaxID=2053187 RepID=A0A2N0VJK0_9BACT|nr:serine hydrolase [Rhodohalobacter barkolensis]PKD44360.1 hypothetical protein CWD77_02510 [Rhodohalobacter barkolensis]
MRILKFISAFVGTALVLGVVVIGLNWTAFNTFLENREAFMEGSDWVPKTESLRGLTEYIEQNPQNVSVASIVLEHPDSTIFYEADTPRTMGALSNIFLMTAYAIEMESGDLNPEELISVNDIDKYVLPQIDNSVHADAITFAEEKGWVQNGEISVQDAFVLLSHFNDPALSDYLWWKLEPFDWDGLMDQFGLESTDTPLPFSGIYLTISESVSNQFIDELISDWDERSKSEFRDYVIQQSNEFTTDSTIREELTKEFEDDRLGRSFMEERDAMELFPKATARDLTTFLEQIYTQENISSRASERILNWLRSPYSDRSEIQRDFTDYGALFDNRMGLLNGVDFGTLVYTGETKFQAIIFDNLPIGFWFHMSGNHMHQDFQQRLIYDPALIDLMEQVSLSDNQERSEIN